MMQFRTETDARRMVDRVTDWRWSCPSSKDPAHPATSVLSEVHQVRLDGQSEGQWWTMRISTDGYTHRAGGRGACRRSGFSRGCLPAVRQDGPERSRAGASLGGPTGLTALDRSGLGGDDLGQGRAGPAVGELAADLTDKVDELDDEGCQQGVP